MGNEGKFCGCCPSDCKMLCMIFGVIVLLMAAVCILGNLIILAVHPGARSEYGYLINLILYFFVDLCTIICAILLICGAAKMNRILLLVWIIGGVFILLCYLTLFIISVMNIAEKSKEWEKAPGYKGVPPLIPVASFHCVMNILLFTFIVLGICAAIPLRNQSQN